MHGSFRVGADVIGRANSLPSDAPKIAESGPALTEVRQPIRRAHSVSNRLDIPAAGDNAPSGDLAGVQHPPARAANLQDWSDRANALARTIHNSPTVAARETAPEANLQGISLSDVDRMKRLYDLRRGAVVTPEVPQFERQVRGGAGHHAAPHDPTEDPVEHKVMGAEMVVGGLEMGVLGFQGAVGKLTAAGQASEAVGTFFGMIPELLALREQNRQLGNNREALAAETQLKDGIAQQAHLLSGLLSPDNAPLAERNVAAPPDFEALRGQLNALPDEQIAPQLRGNLGRSIDLLENLYQGQSVSAAHLEHTHHELTSDIKKTRIAIAGAVTEGLGAVATTTAEIGEHTVPHLVGTLGYGVGAVGGALTLPFTIKFLKDNAQSIAPHTEAAQSAQLVLKDTAKAKAAALSPTARPEALKRSLAKLAARQSEPGGKKLKTGIFSLALGSSLTSIGGGIAMAAGAAALAGTLATVGTVLGVTALVGFVGYSIYKAVQNRKADGAYRTDDLKKVITGEANPISGPLKTRQRDKLLNRAVIASCEQFAHAQIDKIGIGAPVPKFDDMIAAPLRKHAEALLARGPYAANADKQLVKQHVDRMIEDVRSRLTLLGDGRIIGSNPQDGRWTADANYTIGQGAEHKDEFADTLKQSVSRALARTLRSFNQERIALVQDRAGFVSTLDRIEDELASDSYRISLDNRKAIAAALAEAMPDADPIQSWAQAPSDTLDLQQLIEDQSTDLARAAALRKLMRRDPESLLLTYVQSLRDAVQVQDADLQARLEDDLRTFGATRDTLALVGQAADDAQIFHAAAMLSKELKFLS